MLCSKALFLSKTGKKQSLGSCDIPIRGDSLSVDGIGLTLWVFVDERKLAPLLCGYQVSERETQLIGGRREGE